MTENQLQVPVVVGTRPEAIKLVSLILALRASENYNPIVVSTGQHNRLVEYIFELADIRPDVTLWAGSRRAALNERVASVMQRFEDFCVERFDIDPDVIPSREDILAGKHPALVLVHGDTSSAMAAALASFHLRIPVMHVEAGLRTGGSNLTPFPEELNRQVISTIAAMHFAPTSENLGNLVRENVPVEQVFVTGNTGIDALRWSAEMNVQFANPDLQALVDSDRRIVVVTAHRRENWGDGLRGIAEGVARVADGHPEVSVVLPVHPNPRVREVLIERLQGLDNVLLTDPLGYATFSRLLGRCHLVITDSGGIQEEAPSLGKPVLVTRETTERTEGLAAGTLRLVGTDPHVIFTEADKLLDNDAAYKEMAEAENPYGDGHAAERIVACLEHLLLGTNPPTQFGTGYSRAAVAIAAGMRSGRGVGVEALRQAIDEAALSAPQGIHEAVGEAELETELIEQQEEAASMGGLSMLD
ncbi:MAG: UDP-N-acetylglucosamine 2-epimerase (non-hydrolyzing) [Actinobacteria bacterium]|nr:UDP-N-acetylglucosamine 2-epimerase (non-hydrolyzing) [Actinomycetota bacterium]